MNVGNIEITERIEMEVGSEWVDLSVDAFQDFSYDNGIRGSDMLRRTASPGKLTFVLNNSSRNSAGVVGYYTPGHSNARSGFEKGARVRLVISIESFSVVKWQGRIEDIQPHPRFPGLKTKVICYNFVRILQNPMEVPVAVANKTASEGVTEILDIMAQVPEETDLAECAVTYDEIFDVISSDSTALREITKLVLGEFGWFFIKGGEDSGEILTLQGRNTRENSSKISIPKGRYDSAFLIAEDGKFVTDEDGHRIVLEESEIMEFTPKAYNPGKLSKIYNEIIVKCYPRSEDETAVVLYEHSSTVSLEAGESLDLTVNYSDPDQQAQTVTAVSIEDLVSGSDYWANTERDQSGTDKTSALVISLEEGTAQSVFHLENNDEETIYVYLQLRGKGRYAYQSVEVVAKDSTSIANYGRQRLMVDTYYMNNESAAKQLAEAILLKTKEPATEVEVIYLEPLLNSQNFYSFLFLEPGDRVPIKNETLGIDGDYFLQHYSVSRSEKGEFSVIYTVLSERLSTL